VNLKNLTFGLTVLLLQQKQQIKAIAFFTPIAGCVYNNLKYEFLSKNFEELEKNIRLLESDANEWRNSQYDVMTIVMRKPSCAVDEKFHAPFLIVVSYIAVKIDLHRNITVRK